MIVDQQITLEPQNLSNFAQQAKQFKLALADVPLNRVYALDDESRRGLVALNRAVQLEKEEQKVELKHLSELLYRLSYHIPTLVQSWKKRTEEELPVTVWRDPSTDQPLPNPFGNPPDLKGQTVLLQRDPKLAEHLEAMAIDPYGRIAALQDASERRKELAAISYSEKDHATNPFRGNDQTAMAQFVRQHGEQIAKIWAEEALPVQLPWSVNTLNRSSIGTIYVDLNNKPCFGVTGEAILAALKIDEELLFAQRREATSHAEAAQKRSQQLAAR